MLALDVQWLSSAYEAQLVSDGDAEWPPHPARMFCALVSVAQPGSEDDHALRWLEALPAPEIEVPTATHSRRQAYVVTNAVESSGGHQTHPGRTSGYRSWARSLPTAPVARFVWPQASPDADLVTRLQSVARRVPYLGRSTSPALLSFSENEGDHGHRLQCFHPVASGRCRVRVPHPGYLDQLREAFADPLLDRPSASVVSYAAPDEVPAPVGVAPAPPAWPHLVTLAFESFQPVDGRQAVAVATAFKAALLSRLGKPRPPADDWAPIAKPALALLHGHYDHSADLRRQCAVMALPAVGDPHADGHILGVGLAISPHLAGEVLTPLLRLLGFDRPPRDRPRLTEVHVPGIGPLRLRRSDNRWALTPERWSGPARDWATILPIVLDRYPRRGYTAADAVADGCTWAGLDRPDRVEILASSPVFGAPHLVRSSWQRPGGPARPAVHARLHFSRPVRGPVLVGHLRHLGLGVCVPLDADHGRAK